MNGRPPGSDTTDRAAGAVTLATRPAAVQNAAGGSAGEAALGKAAHAGIHREDAAGERLIGEGAGVEPVADRRDIEGRQVGPPEGGACDPPAGQLDDPVDRAV